MIVFLLLCAVVMGLHQYRAWDITDDEVATYIHVECPAKSGLVYRVHCFQRWHIQTMMTDVYNLFRTFVTDLIPDEQFKTIFDYLVEIPLRLALLATYPVNVGFELVVWQFDPQPPSQQFMIQEAVKPFREILRIVDLLIRVMFELAPIVAPPLAQGVRVVVEFWLFLPVYFWQAVVQAVMVFCYFTGLFIALWFEGIFIMMGKLCFFIVAICVAVTYVAVFVAALFALSPCAREMLTKAWSANLWLVPELLFKNTDADRMAAATDRCKHGDAPVATAKESGTTDAKTSN